MEDTEVMARQIVGVVQGQRSTVKSIEVVKEALDNLVERVKKGG